MHQGVGVQDRPHETECLDAEFAEQQSGDGARRGASCRLSGAGPLERLATVGRQPLDGAGQIRMARTRSIDRRRARRIVQPAVPIGNLQHDRPAGGLPLPNPGEHGGRIGFDLLPSSPAVSTLPSAQLAVDE